MYRVGENTKNIVLPMAAIGVAAVAASVAQAAETNAAIKPKHNRHVRDVYSFDWPRQARVIEHAMAFEKKEEKLHEKRIHIEKHLTPAQMANKLIPHFLYVDWVRVHNCEEPVWNVSGSEYSGGIGESNVNWTSYGGSDFAYSAAAATPQEQMVIGDRIQVEKKDSNGQVIYPAKNSISQHDWTSHGGLKYTLTPAKANIDERITVLQTMHLDVPDQGGCGHGW